MPPRNLQMRMALIALSNHLCSRRCEAAARLELAVHSLTFQGEALTFQGGAAGSTPVNNFPSSVWLQLPAARRIWCKVVRPAG